MTVNEGEAFVAGTDAETAQQLLDAAQKAGLDASVVRVAPGDGGFIVPAELVNESKPKTAAKPDAGKSTSKK